MEKREYIESLRGHGIKIVESESNDYITYGYITPIIGVTPTKDALICGYNSIEGYAWVIHHNKTLHTEDGKKVIVDIEPKPEDNPKQYGSVKDFSQALHTELMILRKNLYIK